MIDQRITCTTMAIPTHSPVTEKSAKYKVQSAKGMTLAKFFEASITTADNTAANLLLTSFGRLEMLTAPAKVGVLLQPLARYGAHCMLSWTYAPTETSATS